MHLKSDSIEIMMNDKADEIIEEIFHSLKSRYQSNLESTKGSGFVLDYLQLLWYKCHKINSNYSGLLIGSPDWIKNKKTTTNPSNKKITNVFNMP